MHLISQCNSWSLINPCWPKRVFVFQFDKHLCNQEEHPFVREKTCHFGCYFNTYFPDLLRMEVLLCLLIFSFASHNAAPDILAVSSAPIATWKHRFTDVTDLRHFSWKHFLCFCENEFCDKIMMRTLGFRHFNWENIVSAPRWLGQ